MWIVRSSILASDTQNGIMRSVLINASKLFTQCFIIGDIMRAWISQCGTVLLSNTTWHVTIFMYKITITRLFHILQCKNAFLDTVGLGNCVYRTTFSNYNLLTYVRRVTLVYLAHIWIQYPMWACQFQIWSYAFYVVRQWQSCSSFCMNTAEQHSISQKSEAWPKAL